MEENRINRRSRPRPYDLRRKVLLKNFLREQMTFIPGAPIETFSSNGNNNNDNNEPAISLNLDEDLPELNDENVSSIASTDQQCPSFSASDAHSDLPVTEMKVSTEENTSDSRSLVEKSNDSSHSSSLNKITSFMKLRSGSKKKQKGIVKAKEAIKSPTKSKPVKRGIDRIFSRKKSYESSPQNSKSRNSPRSLFSLFKNRRAQRNSEDTNRTKSSPYDNQKQFGYRTKHSPTNQTIQTGDTWLRQALLKEQQSNRLLREENRILSESLSYFMSGSSMDSQNIRGYCSTMPDKHAYGNVYHDYFPPLTNTSNGWNPRSRVVRSKSVQEHSERKTLLRNNYRTRSMNCHNLRNKVLLPDPKPPSTYSSQYDGYNPRLRRKTILANLPVNSAVRGIQRRSSMPERILSENDRSLVCRRAGSFRDSYHRKPFHSLPSEAFY